jgi:hypothetical protein
MNKNLEKQIREYFSLVNPLPYDCVKFCFNENINKYLITIYVDSYQKQVEYLKSEGNEMYILKKIRLDMEDMFPYSFKVYCVI